jgi:hypothetical protein
VLTGTFLLDEIMDKSNRTVFLLWHTRHAKEETDQDNEKLLGVYSKKEYAEEKIRNKYRNLPGFRDTDGEFTIDPYVIDEGNWNEGYCSVK